MDDTQPKSDEGAAPNRAPAINAQPVTVGRTQWDAAVDIVRLLGNGAPYLIIVGIGIYGFIKFQDLNQQRDRDLQAAREKAAQGLQAQLDQAHKSLIGTYESMGEISQKQLQNLKATLEVQDTTTARAKIMQAELENLNRQASDHRRESETAKHETQSAMIARKEAEEQRQVLQRTMDGLKIEGDKLQTDLLKKRKELQEIEQKEKDRQRSQTLVAEQIGEIRKKMYELARAVKNRLPSAEPLASAILKDADLAVAQGESILTAPERFIGRSDAELIKVIDADDAVSNAVRVSIETSKGVFILVAESLVDNVFRNIANFELDGARVVSAEKTEFIAGVLFPAADNWFLTNPKVVVVNTSRGHSDAVIIDVKGSGNDEWDISKLDFGTVPVVQRIKGEPFKAKFLTVQKFDSLLKAGTTGLQFEPGYLAYKRSLSFSSSAAFPQSVSGVPADLREVVVRFLEALVSRDKEKASTFAVPSMIPILGQVAAIALRQDFQFVGVPSAPRLPAQQQAEPASSITLVATYNRSGQAKKETASFRFSNADNAGWKLEQFIPAALIAGN